MNALTAVSSPPTSHRHFVPPLVLFYLNQLLSSSPRMLSPLFASFLAFHFLYRVSPSLLLYWFTHVRVSIRNFHHLFRDRYFGQVGPV